MESHSNIFYCLLLFTLGLYPINADAACVFDKIKLTSPLRQHVTYKDIQHKTRVIKKRSILHAANYRPIRIHVHYGNVDEELMPSEKDKLMLLVDLTVDKVKSIFSVVPVDGVLLLRRDIDACRSEWPTGPNKGKCASIRRSYKGETCLDKFRIPEDHLEGISVWNATHPDPVRETAGGRGVRNADYILYVQSLTSTLCAQPGLNVVAYTAYCQLDQNDRPIAGYVNFCPAVLRDQPVANLQQTALHEFFHALGFSSELMQKFKACSWTDAGLKCTNRKAPIREVGGTLRLVTPKVVRLTSEHFNCTTHQTLNEFGPMLEMKDGKAQSHWDAAFMFSSIMTPTVANVNSDLVILDPITLAAFEDSGWYRVNHSAAGAFWWGRDGGCDFGSFPACQQDSKFFCSTRTNGCHYLHEDKAICSSSVFLKGCKVMKANPGGSCVRPPFPNDLEQSNEIFGASSRCFLSNLTESGFDVEPEMKPRCFLHQCNAMNRLHVKVGSSGWYSCPTDTDIQISGYDGVITCPDNLVLCGPRRPPARHTSPVTSTTPVTSAAATATRRRQAVSPFSSTDEQTLIVWITFLGVNYDLVATSRSEFSEQVILTVQYLTGVNRRRLLNAKIVRGSIILRFDLIPPIYGDDGPPSSDVVSQLQLLVHNRSLSVFLSSDNTTYIASYIRIELGGPKLAYEGLSLVAILFIVFGSLVIASVFGLLVFMVQRHYAIEHGRVSPRGGDGDGGEGAGFGEMEAVAYVHVGTTDDGGVRASDVVLLTDGNTAARQRTAAM